MQRLPIGRPPVRRSPRRLLAALPALLMASAPALGAAEPKPKEDPYEELLQQADRALQAQRPLEALTAWRAAWSLRQTYFVACNLGKAELLHGEPRDEGARKAAELLTVCLRLFNPTTPEEKQKRELFAADLEKARSQTATLRIVVSQSGAAIQIDDRPLGRSPLSDAIFVTPGPHTIAADLEGYERAAVRLSTKQGEALTVPITLTQSAARAKPKTAPLLPVAQRSIMPAARPALSRPILVGGASASGFGLSLGATLLFVRGEMKESALLREKEARLRNLEDCDGSAADVTCSKYLGIERGRAVLQGAAITGFIGAGLAATATVIYALAPRSSAARAIGRGEGLKVAF